MTVTWEGDHFTEAEGQVFLQHLKSAVQLVAAGKKISEEVLAEMNEWWNKYIVQDQKYATNDGPQHARYQGLQDLSQKILENKFITKQESGELRQLAKTVRDFCGPTTEKEALKLLKINAAVPRRSVQDACAELQATISIEKSRLEKVEKLYTQYSRELQATPDKKPLDENVETRELFREALKRWKFQRKDAMLTLAVALEKAKMEGVEIHFFRLDAQKVTEKKGPLMNGFEHVMKAGVDTWSPQLGWF